MRESKRVARFGPRKHPARLINTKGHWAVGTIWVTDKGYETEMHDKGFTCSCPAFKYCKHINKVEMGFCPDD